MVGPASAVGWISRTRVKSDLIPEVVVNELGGERNACAAVAGSAVKGATMEMVTHAKMPKTHKVDERAFVGVLNLDTAPKS